MLVVVGSGTRLARELLLRPDLNRRRTVLVARDPDEADRLGAFFPRFPQHCAWDEKAELPDAPEGVGLVVASALVEGGGPCSVYRDLWSIARVLRRYEEVPVHMTWASHVTSLDTRAPSNALRSVETALRSLADGFALTTLSVVHTGRRVERRMLARPASFAGTSYATLAGTLLELSTRVRGVGRVLGVDARFELGRMAVECGLAALSGRVSTLRINERMRRDAPATVGNYGATRALQSPTLLHYDRFADAAGDESLANGAKPIAARDSRGKERRRG